MKTAAVLSLAATASAKTYFSETFDDDKWSDRWTVSSARDSAEVGAFKRTAGKYSKEGNTGIQTSEDARFYAISADLDSEINNKGQDLVIQYTVKNEQDIDCGGAYIKLMKKGLDKANFGGDSDYAVMFGPDICGYSTKKTHVIVNYGGKNVQTNEEPRCESDVYTHTYTLWVKPDNTYEVRIDGEVEKSGDLAEHFDLLEPKEIKDPEQSKPEDWVDEKMIDDPEDVKPEGYDDIPEKIVDPDAAKPDDWDDEEDGEWEAPMISNPEYKGAFVAKRIDNPAYKGEWEHPMVPNPDFKDDANLHAFCSPCVAAGFELWQVKSGTVFDNILVTDSIEEAEAALDNTAKDAEKEQKEAADKAEEEKKKAEEEAKKAAEGDEEDEEEKEEL
jgi:calreticulin